MYRLRFAPSPTGPLHIGGVRTALFNYLFAKKHCGKFILRIEDTDQQRLIEGAEKYIIDSLSWCGIVFDESVHIGGEYGPYRQSERKEIYFKYVNELIEKGHAYYAFDTPEELKEIRDKVPNFQYDVKTRVNMKNSLMFSQKEVNNLVSSGYPYVVRIKIPENTTIEFQDVIRGLLKFDSNLLDDKVIFKSDGLPTYHLANVVDDHLMKITHVIRGEEWLPSCPLHVLLYDFFGWKKPVFAHLPLILKPQGSGKLSKRDGDKFGFPVFPTNWTDPTTQEVSIGYKEWGYLPEAFINMLALLGWNSGTSQEIFSMEELINEFSLEKVNKSGARFNLEKIKWFNHQYILNTDINKLSDIFERELVSKKINADKSYIEQVVRLVRDRLELTSEFWENSYYFFIEPESYDEKVLNKHWTDEAPEWLNIIVDVLHSIADWNTNNIEKILKESVQTNNIPMGKIFNLLRLALVGTNKGIDIANIIHTLGKEESLRRIGNLPTWTSQNQTWKK